MIDITKPISKITYNGVEVPIKTPADWIDGTLETFNAGGAKTVAMYRCYQFGNLKDIDLSGVEMVNNYAFYSCRNVENIVWGDSLTHIYDFAFSNLGSTDYANKNLDFSPVNDCFVSSSAFENALGLKKITGNFTSIGTKAFQGATYVQELNITGTMTDYLYASTFAYIGSKRTNPEQNIFYMNFKNSTIKNVGASCFAGASSTQPNQYMEIRLPQTVNNIETSVFANSNYLDIYFYGSPATLNSGAFTRATNHKIFVPFTKINAYRTATNWSAQSANIYGFADVGIFAQGQKLPMYNSEGYALTWYSDNKLTQVVTEVADPEAEYYCIAGTEKVAVGITQLYADGVDLVVSDGTNQYYKNYGVPIGTVLTITATPTAEGLTPYQFTLNGETIASGATYTAVADTDINIIAIYWDGVNMPATPNFANNTWASIKAVAQAGTASELGWAVGDTKPITIEGATYNVRISDMTAGRYQYSNENRTTNMAFELVELLPTTRRMNATAINAGGWAESEMRKTLNGLDGGQANILSTLPTDLQELLEEVQIKSADTGSTGYAITESSNKLFLLSYAEVSKTTNTQYTKEGTIWQYYDQNSTDANRIKYGANDMNSWWLRSPYAGYANRFNYVNYNGIVAYKTASDRVGVSFAFAW